MDRAGEDARNLSEHRSVYLSGRATPVAADATRWSQRCDISGHDDSLLSR